MLNRKQQTNNGIDKNKPCGILEMVRRAQENDDMQKALTILAEKQKRYIQIAKSSSLNETVPPQIEKKIIETEFIPDSDLSPENPVTPVSERKTRKPKIISPFHDQPSIDLNELVRNNQTDAQIFLSKVKEKNQNFIQNVFDY